MSETARELLAEAVVVHASLSVGLVATARRAALATEQLAAAVGAAIPADAVDRTDAALPEDTDDPAAWARLALGIRDDHDDGDEFELGGAT